MGYLKEKQIELDEQMARGYIIPKAGQKFLCACHYQNFYLSKFIKQKGTRGRCSYCGKETTVIDLADFLEYVGNRLTNYLGPIDNENLYLKNSFLDKEDQNEDIPGYIIRGQYIAPDDAEYYENVDEVMDEYDLLSDNNNLDDDIGRCLIVDQWIRKDPTSLLLQDEMLLSWQCFSDLVKKRQRYTFFKNKNYYSNDTDAQELETDIIEDVSNMVMLLEENIEVGTLLYRGRPEDNNSPFTTFKSLTAPPVSSAKANRMSPHAISMFYGSFDKKTPQLEILNYLDDKKKIYIGVFKTIKPLKVINLCKIPKPDFWMEDEDDWKKYAFLHLFHMEISKPVGKADPELEYIPSQVFSEYLRYIQKSKDGDSYDGIVYQSALTKQYNIVLFYDNLTSSQILELVRVN